MGGWIADHIGETISIITLIVGNLVGYARLVFHSKLHARRLSVIETTLSGHVTDSGAHRNPDFERRLEDLSDTLDEIKVDVKTLLKKEN